MGLAFLYILQNFWPLSLFKFDDLKASDELVNKLSLPETTKRFVFAVRDPGSQSVIYILCAQNLSERSAVDAECLIRAVRPDAVVAQVGPSALVEIQSEESELGNNGDCHVPTSAFGVLKRCFIDKINKESYESVAGNLVLREIFGTSFYGHIVAAKRVANDVGSSFMVLESPCLKSSSMENPSGEVDAQGSLQFQGLASSLMPQKLTSAVALCSRRFCLTDDIQSQMVKLLSPFIGASANKLNPSSSVSKDGVKEIQLGSYQVPQFAQSFFPLLLDLHNIFNDIPSMARALALSQKMLYDVNQGEVVDTQELSEVYTFRIAVEGLRIALNNAGRLPMEKLRTLNKMNIDFPELPVEDKSHALLAHALQSQAQNFKTIVAIVDASGLAGLRKNWGVTMPPDVKHLVGQLVTSFESDDEVLNHMEKKWSFSNKPVLAVGAGATAVLGASSLSKFFPVSTFMKAIVFKFPASLKLILTHTQKTMAITLGKTLVPSKIVAPGLANSGANATSVLKAAASAEKIRMAAHSLIASAEKTSFSAMRTSFYEIMRKRRVQSIGLLTWATFGFSVATCSGLLMYGDGIECAAESFPSARSIASLGRGIQNLHQASQEVGPTDRTIIQKSIESLIHRLKKTKIQ